MTTIEKLRMEADSLEKIGNKEQATRCNKLAEELESLTNDKLMMTGQLQYLRKEVSDLQSKLTAAEKENGLLKTEVVILDQTNIELSGIVELLSSI